MTAIICRCQNKIRIGEIPNPSEWLFISDSEYDHYSGSIDAERLYADMNSFLQCKECGRLWFFWSGFDSEPISYLPEKKE